MEILISKPDQQAKGLKDIDRLLGFIRHTAILSAFASYFLLLQLFFYGLALKTEFFIGIAFLTFALLSYFLGRKKLSYSITINSDAAEYVKYIKKVWRFYRTPSFFTTMLALIALQIVLNGGIALSTSASYAFLASVAVFYIVRLCMLKMLDKIEITVVETTSKNIYSRKKELLNAVLATAIYFLPILLAYFAASYAFHSLLMFLYVPLIATTVFLLFCLVSNPFKRYSSVRRQRPATRILRMLSLLAVAILIAELLTTGALVTATDISNTKPAGTEKLAIKYDTKTGVYSITRPENRDLRILQLTDIHISCGMLTSREDRMALAACKEVITKAKPDLVIVTGDLAYPLGVQTLSHDNALPIATFAMFMEHLEVPWAFIYGNHDTEVQATKSAQQINQMLCSYYAMRISGDSKQLLMADIQPDIYGRYNQYIRIENATGKTERILYLMDSNDYTSDGGYDNIHDDQVQWYENTVKANSVPSFMFLHIPFDEYMEASNALQSNSPAAEYLFGKNDEDISECSMHTKIFDSILDNNSTQAVFCGHDHINTLGVRYKGVDLVFGMSIDYLAYPGITQRTDQRGGTLILCNAADYKIEQVPLIENN